MVGWYVGAGINLLGSVAINLGTNIMKLGHNKRALLELPEDQKPPVSRFREWQVGTAIFVVGNVANFVSFGYAAQSLLAALGSVQFVSNVIFASLVLNEKVTGMIITATCCIIGGCLMLVLFGNHSSDDYTVSQLLELYRAPAYIVYLVMMFVFVIGSYILYLHGKHVANQKGREQSLWVAILPVSYSIFSALLGTQSVLFSKSLSVLLRTTVSGDSQLGNWYTWVTLICFVISAGFWVTRLNKGLRLFDAMIIVPLMQICWTLFSIISGMLYFKEYVTFNPSTAKHGPLSAIMFSFGVSVVFVGVFLLTKSGRKQEQQYEDVDQDAKEDEFGQVQGDVYDGDHKSLPGHSEAGGKVALSSTPGSPRVGVDPDVPQKDKISMDTLRFTSLASSTAANIKTMTKHERQKRLGMTMSPSGRGSPGPASPGAMDGSDGGGNADFSRAGSIPGSGGGMHSTMASRHDGDDGHSLNSTATKMMNTLKKGTKSTIHALRKDFNVDLDDFKQMFGMGEGSSGLPALSLFAMPAVDFNNTRKSSHKKGNAEASPRNAILSLPSSRFYNRDMEGGLDGATNEAKQARWAAAGPGSPATPTRGHSVSNSGRTSPRNSNSQLRTKQDGHAQGQDSDGFKLAAIYPHGHEQMSRLPRSLVPIEEIESSKNPSEAGYPEVPEGRVAAGIKQEASAPGNSNHSAGAPLKRTPADTTEAVHGPSRLGKAHFAPGTPSPSPSVTHLDIAAGAQGVHADRNGGAPTGNDQQQQYDMSRPETLPTIGTRVNLQSADGIPSAPPISASQGHTLAQATTSPFDQSVGSSPEMLMMKAIVRNAADRHFCRPEPLPVSPPASPDRVYASMPSSPHGPHGAAPIRSAFAVSAGGLPQPAGIHTIHPATMAVLEQQGIIQPPAVIQTVTGRSPRESLVALPPILPVDQVTSGAQGLAPHFVAHNGMAVNIQSSQAYGLRSSQGGVPGALLHSAQPAVVSLPTAWASPQQPATQDLVYRPPFHAHDVAYSNPMYAHPLNSPASASPEALHHQPQHHHYQDAYSPANQMHGQPRGYVGSADLLAVDRSTAYSDRTGIGQYANLVPEYTFRPGEQMQNPGRIPVLGTHRRHRSGMEPYAAGTADLLRGNYQHAQHAEAGYGPASAGMQPLGDSRSWGPRNTAMLRASSAAADSMQPVMSIRPRTAAARQDAYDPANSRRWRG